MRNFIAGLALPLLLGCGTTSTTKIEVAAATPSAFDIQDERPLEQRISSRATESYGEVTRIGDDGITPPGPQLLKAWLSGKLGDRLSGKKIVLTEFSVHVVDPQVTIDERGFSNAMASTPGANPLSGLLARWLIQGIESVKSDKTVGVRISGTVDGVGFSAQGGDSFKGRVSEANINSVITQALDNTVTEIDRLINGVPASPNPVLQPVSENGG